MAMWQVPYDRGAMMRMLREDLAPFVDRFRYEWPDGFSEATLRNAIFQCTTLRKFARTLEDGDRDKMEVDEWLLPPGGRMGGAMTMVRYWAHMSPLNLLNFVMLCVRSRYAAMVAWALAPLLCDYDRPHASTGDVLQAWNGYLDVHGPLCWDDMEAIVSRPLPQRWLAIAAIEDWIFRSRTEPRGPQSLLVWFLYREFAYYGPPRSAPYALE